MDLVVNGPRVEASLDSGSISKRTALHLRAAKALPDREVQVLRQKTAFPKKSRCNGFIAILFSAP